MASTAIERTLGLAGVLSIGALALVGGWALASNLALETPDAMSGRVAATVATLVLAVAVVAVLSALGARSKRWLENPYW